MKRALTTSLIGLCFAVGMYQLCHVSQSSAAVVTFNKDIAPIIQTKCQACHRPGEVAPMALLTYKQVRPWAKSIREAVTSRTMPPWFADEKHTEFSNDPRLSQKEIDTIQAWVSGGAPEGDPKDLPPNPNFPEGWQIGKPDVVLPMTVEFNIPAEGTIPYKYFAVPTNFTEDKFVQFAEIRQGDRAHVHHVIVSVRYPEHGELPPAGEIEPAKLSSVRRSSNDRPADSDGRLVGWAPGEAPLELREGQAKLVKKGSVLIFQVHYTTNGEAGKDRSSVGLIFSKAPVEKRVITAGAVQSNFVIPAGAANHEVASEFTFKEDSHIDSLHPHMHMRGKDFKYTLVYPDGKSKVLLWIPRWDFGWQLTYVFKEEVFAPKGSKLVCVAHYDNSINNKFNPDPTKDVRWGDQTWEEMMIGYLDYTLDKQDLRKQPQAASSSSSK
ncbi:MAG: thiol-disulfide isomerase [Acidobacteria bacterium]|nr:thiol-disulfide isomerase [Acidobacteriota bacterium]